MLFSEIVINGMTLKNRIIMTSMVTNYAARNGEVTDELICYHEERAKGGCAMNMLEATYVSPEGNSYFRGVGISDDFHVPGLKRLVDAVHARGGRIGVQLQHGGRTARSLSTGLPVLLVSAIPGRTPVEESREMAEEDIHHVVEAYRMAALRAKTAGFDAVEVHAAHGYLLCQFLSPFTNQRTDAYGGDLKRRMRAPMEVMNAVREAVGPDYPVIVRLSVEEFVENGQTLEDAAEIARSFVRHGADALSVSVGTTETNRYIIPPACLPEAFNAERAGYIREAVGHSVPVIVAGRICTPAVAEGVLRSGRADIVGMGRELIADPYFPAKLRSGRADSILVCVACNEGCVGAMARLEPASCALNPQAGYEARYPMIRAARTKRVLVVGAGPAGMYAAYVAALRGHDVSLWEREETPGGLLNIAKLPPYKGRYGDFVRCMEKRLSEQGVQMELYRTACRKNVEIYAPDVVLVATGSVPFLPTCACGAPLVCAEEVLKGAAVGQNILVLGGGLVGCETAEVLAERKLRVTILELRDTLAADMEIRSRHMLVERLHRHGVKMLLNTRVRNIDGEGKISIVDPFGRERMLSGYDTLVAAFGYRPDTDLYAELADMSIPVHRIGDCLKVANVRMALRSALETAYEL